MDNLWEHQLETPYVDLTLGKVGFDGFTTSGQVIDVTYIWIWF